MDIRNFFFKYRSFTPIPLAVMIIYFAQRPNPYWLYGLFLVVVGESIRIWAVSYAGGETRTRTVGAPALCSAGPFARVRNPLYVGNMMMYTGIVLIAGSPSLWSMLLITLIFFYIQYSLIVSLEEETLLALFGDTYETYRENTPAIIPRFKAWPNDDIRLPMSLGKTLKTEKRTLQNISLIIISILIRVSYFP
ncbi:MAG: isoprenylcysteine carboxylmethyltransferase family protein [Candidatus Neomarinimicrobiota bacterium]